MRKQRDIPAGHLLHRTFKGDVVIILLVTVLSLIGLALCQSARAADPLNLEFRGTLVEPPPCKINDEKTITVSFGNQVGVNKVASGIYRQPLPPLALICEQSSLAWQMRLTWTTAAPASFDSDNATIATAEQANLGVKLYADGKVFPMNTALNINSSALPKLEAELVQKADSTLTEGAFTARGTLRADYQ